MDEVRVLCQAGWWLIPSEKKKTNSRRRKRRQSAFDLMRLLPASTSLAFSIPEASRTRRSRCSGCVFLKSRRTMTSKKVPNIHLEKTPSLRGAESSVRVCLLEPPAIWEVELERQGPFFQTVGGKRQEMVRTHFFKRLAWAMLPVLPWRLSNGQLQVTGGKRSGTLTKAAEAPDCQSSLNN